MDEEFISKKLAEENKKLGELSELSFLYLAKLPVICNKDVMVSYLDFKRSSIQPKMDNIFGDKMIRLTKAIREGLGGKKNELDWLHDEADLE